MQLCIRARDNLTCTCAWGCHEHAHGSCSWLPLWAQQNSPIPLPMCLNKWFFNLCGKTFERSIKDCTETSYLCLHTSILWLMYCLRIGMGWWHWHVLLDLYFHPSGTVVLWKTTIACLQMYNTNCRITSEDHMMSSVCSRDLGVISSIKYIGQSEVRALPGWRCRRAARQA